ncbi:MAG TPA: hypothetical protein VGN11_06450, partial [Candidatus Baltobacteraceae bacterium]|nr:hypothetical protein [Candidatus Baltobacteraceae bacterium]
MGLFDLAADTARIDGREAPQVLHTTEDYRLNAFHSLLQTPEMYSVDDAGTMKLTKRGEQRLTQIRADDPPQAPSSTVTTALSAIAKFVPTEIVGIYVAVGTMIVGWNDVGTLVFWFWVCLVLSAAFFIIAYLTDHATDIRTHAFKLSVLFVWRLVATMSAFVIWAAAISPEMSAHLPFLAGLAH